MRVNVYAPARFPPLLVIGKHKGFSPFQTGNRAERDQIVAWTNNDAQGMLHVAEGFCTRR